MELPARDSAIVSGRLLRTGSLHYVAFGYAPDIQAAKKGRQRPKPNRLGTTVDFTAKVELGVNRMAGSALLH